MGRHLFTGTLQKLVTRAESGNREDIDYIMEQLKADSNLATTRFVDFALSLVKTPEGMERIEYYLFEGSQIQRNYASLYLNRLHEWEPIKKAYELGLIDEVQAYSR